LRFISIDTMYQRFLNEENKKSQEAVPVPLAAAFS
jgi:hypothetical protein